MTLQNTNNWNAKFWVLGGIGTQFVDFDNIWWISKTRFRSLKPRLKLKRVSLTRLKMSEYQWGNVVRGKMLILLMYWINILIHLKMAFKSVKYHLTIWSKAIYEKISHIHPWITWYIRAGHGILCLGSLNLMRYTTHIRKNHHSSII